VNAELKRPGDHEQLQLSPRMVVEPASQHGGDFEAASVEPRVPEPRPVGLYIPSNLTLSVMLFIHFQFTIRS